MTRLAMALAAGLAAASAGAQPFDVSWATIDGGGAMGTTGGAFGLSGSIGQPDAGGPAAGGAFGLHSGFWSLVAPGGTAPQADLGVTKTDGVTAVAPGQAIAYAIVVTNAGPSTAAGATVTDVPPPALTGVTWTCAASAGSTCPASGAGAIGHVVTIAVGGTLTYAMTGTLVPTATGTLTNTASVTAPAAVPDPNPADNSATDVDTIVAGGPVAEGELVHGTRLRADLAAVGGQADRDLFRLAQQPFASYEVIVDEASGDVGLGQGPSLDRVAADGSTLLQSSRPIGSGPGRSLRFANTTGALVPSELVRVQSASCTTDCGADDRYRLRAYETTLAVPRFNNAGSQITVLVLQNTTTVPVSVRIDFWSAAGALLLEHPVTLPSRGSISLNTSGLTGLTSLGGSVTLMHDAPYGALVGKAVSLELATGLSFDSVLEPRRR